MRQWTIDAFADRPFMGNPACVVEPFDVWPEDGWLQAVAMENNQSETAFLRRTPDSARFDLRWFTPTMEVDLCGHVTFASGAALLVEMGLDADAVTFDTRSGPLIVRKRGDGFEMDLPADPPRRSAEVSGLADALGEDPVEVWAGRYLAAILPDASAVRRCDPDFKALAKLEGEAGEAGQVIVSALSDEPDVDVVDRFFGPGCGIDEDPATGSAHCILAPLYADKLAVTLCGSGRSIPDAEPISRLRSQVTAC